MKNDKHLTRRELLKKSALGVGTIIGVPSLCSAQGGRGGRGGPPLPIATDNPSIIHNQRYCRNCGRCRLFCRDVTTVFGHPVPKGEDACIHCGQCTKYCRRSAIRERYHYPDVAKAIADTGKIVVASTSPAIRVALGEMFRLPPGTNVEGKIVASLKKLGVDYVLDTTFAADLTIMEESAELLRRLDEKGSLPMFTSCCPAWVRFAKLFYPNFLPNISTTKSPVMMQGVLVKTYFAEKTGIDPSKIVHVALTPCTAKKAEILLPGMNAAGIMNGNVEMRDIDYVLTTRELAYLLNTGKINLAESDDSVYNSMMGAGSGAGMIFGNTGGVMEAALRTAYQKLNDALPPNEFYRMESVRGLDSVRQATVDLGKRKLRVAVVHGIGKARPLLNAIQNGDASFDFVEVMACPGGCIGGGGQPINQQMDAMRLNQMRLASLYQQDKTSEIRMSYENPEIKAVYKDFLGEPLGIKSEQLLHVTNR